LERIESFDPLDDVVQLTVFWSIISLGASPSDLLRIAPGEALLAEQEYKPVQAA
jgi:hypothetical protein